MADWTLPTETTQYLQVLANLKDRDVDTATMRVNPYVNPPVNTIVFSRAAHPYTIQEWDGTAWQNKIISVASGGTGAANLDDFKASLGLGSMAYQNASTVAITGGSATFTSNVLLQGPLHAAYAPADGLAFRLVSRVGDLYTGIQFASRALDAEYGRLYLQAAGTLNSTMHLVPSVDAGINLGAWALKWAYTYSLWHVAPSTGGFIFDQNGLFGMYYSAGKLNIGAVYNTPPAFSIPYGNS